MADALFEQPAEMLRVFESEVVGDLAYGFRSVEDALFGDIDQLGLNIFLGGSAGLLSDQVTEVVGGKVELAGTVANRGETDGLRSVGNEIAVQ